MSERKEFPEFGPDGLALIRFEFALGQREDTSALRDWLSRWLDAHRVWNREWYGTAGEVRRTDVLVFGDSFAGEWELQVENSNSPETIVAVDVRVKTRLHIWKDWLGLLMHDLRRNWPSTRFVSARQLTAR